MRQAGARRGGKDGNFTSEARAHPQPVAAPFFHNFTPGFQPVPPLLWLKDPGVKEAFRKVESRMVLGRGQETRGGEGRRESDGCRSALGRHAGYGGDLQW